MTIRPPRDRLLVVMLWGLAAFTFLAVWLAWNQARVSRNSDDIRRLVYGQCTDRNATTKRQNGLIDRAIDAERRRSNPSADTINSLNDFKGTLSDCGPRP